MNLLNENILQALNSLKSLPKKSINLLPDPTPLSPTKKHVKLPKRLIHSVTQPEGMKKSRTHHRQRHIIKQTSLNPRIEEVRLELPSESQQQKKREIHVTDGTQELILRQQEISKQTKKKNINEEISDLKKLEQQLLTTYTGRYDEVEQEEKIETVLNERREQIYRKIYENVKALQGTEKLAQQQKERDKDLLEYIQRQQNSHRNQPHIQQQLLTAKKQVEQLQKLSRPGTSQRISSASSNQNEDIKAMFIKQPTIKQQKLSPKPSIAGSNYSSQRNIYDSRQQMLTYNQSQKKIDQELLHILLTRWQNINTKKKRQRQKKIFQKMDDEELMKKKRERRMELCQKLLSWLHKMNRCKITLQQMYEFKLPTQPFQIDGSFVFLRYVKYNNFIEIKNLIKFNRNLLFEYNHLGQTCLHIASQRGNAPMLQYLLEQGADYEVKDYMNRNPLWYAVEAQSEECFKMLLKMGATPWNIQTQNSWFATILQQVKRIHTLISISPHTLKAQILEHELARIL